MKCDICEGDFYGGGLYEPPEHCGCGNEALLKDWRDWSRRMWIDFAFARTANWVCGIADWLWRKRFEKV